MVKQFKKNAQGAFEWLDFEPPKLGTLGGERITKGGQTTSIRELLSMHSRGMAIMGNGDEQIYKGEDTMGIDWKGLDLVDRQRITDEAHATIRKIKDDAVAESNRLKAEKAKTMEAEIIRKAIEDHEKAKTAEGQH